jgi:exonuclease III
MNSKPEDIRNRNNKRQRRMYKEIRTNNTLVKIAAININGLNETIKQQSVQCLIEEEKITVMGLSDTKFKENIWLKTMNSKTHKAYWVTTKNQAGGVGLVIERGWAKHINQTIKWEDRIIALEFSFKERRKIGIMQIYLPPQMGKKRDDTIEKAN